MLILLNLSAWCHFTQYEITAIFGDQTWQQKHQWLSNHPFYLSCLGAPKLSHNVLDILRNIFVTLTVVYYQKYTLGLIEIHNINGFYCDLDDFTRIRDMYDSPIQAKGRQMGALARGRHYPLTFRYRVTLISRMSYSRCNSKRNYRVTTQVNQKLCVKTRLKATCNA